MPQFDVHRFRGAARYVVNVQSDLLDGLSTRVVVPAYPWEADLPLVARLNPKTEIEGTPHFLAMQELTAIRTSSLGPVVGSLAAARDGIVAAVDLLVTGI